MAKGNRPMEWAEFTNSLLSRLGKFIMLPLVVIGVLLCLGKNVGLGVLLISGGCMLLVLVALGLVIFKPLLIKKYPIKRPDKYKVDPTIPYEELSDFQKLAVDHCDGDMVEAFVYMVDNLDEATQIAYTKDISSEEAAACLEGMNRVVERDNSEKERRDAVELEIALGCMQLTQEDVLATQKNPFVPKLWAWAGVLLAGCVAGGVVLGFGTKFFAQNIVETVTVIIGVATTFVVFKVVSVLLNLIRFRRAKRIIEEQKDAH